MEIANKTRVVSGLTPAEIPFDDILAGQRPTIFRGMARDWPLVREGMSRPSGRWPI